MVVAGTTGWLVVEAGLKPAPTEPGIPASSVLDDVDFYGAGGFVEGGFEGGGDLF